MIKKTTWSLICKHIIQPLRDTINSSEFIDRHKTSEVAFTRNRVLNFSVIMMFMMNMIKGALQRELDNFFQALNGYDVAVRTITKSAFSAARRKIKETAFTELNSQLIIRWYRTYNVKRWHGLSLFAIDGSTLRLPDYPEIIAFFGQMYPDKGAPVTMARISQLFDPLNNLIHDATIGPYSSDERDFLIQHLNSISSGSLLLLDRGYPAFWVFSALKAQKIYWCARMPLGHWTIVDKFLASSKEDDIVTLKPSSAMALECRTRKLKSTPIKVRLLKICLQSGQVEVLATSLLDQEEYPYSDFQALYHLRWPIEESYKRQKSRLEIENWSGRSELTIRQDYHAKVLSTNITLMMTSPAQELVDIVHKDCKYPMKVNVTHALSIMKNTIVKLIISHDPIKLLRSIIDILAKTIEPVRENRSYPRRASEGGRKYHERYKPCS